MPAVAEPPPELAPPPLPLAASLASFPLRGRPPLAAVDDRTLLAELIGDHAAGLVGRLPVADLLDASAATLVELGLTRAARRRVLACAELARRFQPAAAPPAACRSPRDFLPHLHPLRRARTELLGVLCLDAGLGLAGGLRVVAGGALTHVAVTAREVYGPALERRAAAIVLVHNHPSGFLTPSEEDLAFTWTMQRAGAMLGVQLLDHLVVARRGYVSLVEAGLMGGPPQ